MTVITRNEGEWLIRLLSSRGQLNSKDAVAVAQSDAEHVSEELLRRRLVTKEQLAAAVKDQYGIRFAEPGVNAIEKMAVALVPESLCQKRRVFPLRLDGETLSILMANPLDAEALDEAAAVSGRRPIAVFGLPEKIAELIAEGYGSDAILFDLLKRMPDEEAVTCLDTDDKGVEDEGTPGSVGAPVIKLANLLIAQAVRMKASDIHIEHEERSTVVRYRVDGLLRIIMKVPKSIGEGPLVSRIKIMADLDVSDRRRPQDGRAKLKVGLEEIGLRVSTIPTAFGEKVVLRILDKRSAEVPLEALGFRPDIMERLVALSAANQGMILITGPTGSGKTTTLYSALHRLKADDINIVTVEDPIEYKLDGINQIQVNEKAGMGFAAVLRSVLRQDPDVVLVGEIRDRETADIAFQAALTGHLVFSTLHTNDAVATVSRLLDIGVERYKMAPALLGVVAQRLVRRVCPACRVEGVPSEAVAERLVRAGLTPRQFKGAGCDKCSFTGLMGRLALTELLDLSDPEARELLAAAKDAASLTAGALARGWLKTMTEDALWHMSQGSITYEEALPYLDLRAPRAPSSASAPAIATFRILVVDDVADNRALVLATLGADGYELAEADGGRSSLQQIAARKPDLVLLDLMMPEVDGFAVVKELRGKMGLSNLPILVLTALGEAESQALALEIGADDYMTKPFIPRILRARVKALFRRRGMPD